MKRRMTLLAGILAATAFAAMPFQAAKAEPAGEGSGILDTLLGEEGIAGQLFGEGGLLEGELPEGTDVDGMIDTLMGQLDEADSEIAQVAGSDKAKEEYGSLDLDSLEEILTPVLGQLLTGGADLGDMGDLEGIDIEKLFAQGDMARELATDYILDKNADTLESGDVQIVDVIYEEMGLSQEFPYLTYVQQYNYTEDDEHQLHYLCGSADLLLMTLQEEEDGSLTALDAQVVEEDYETFLQEFCADDTPEDCLESIEFSKAYSPYTLAKYLEDHPEYTGLEYDGEMHTAEELNDIASDQLLVLYPPETESELQ